jgi:hypothetical protein
MLSYLLKPLTDQARRAFRENEHSWSASRLDRIEMRSNFFELRMFLSEDRCPPRITCAAGFFRTCAGR